MGRTDLEDLDQEAELEHISKYKFNAFDGELIVKDLRNHPDLWEKVWMNGGRKGNNWDDEGWYPDALYIMAAERDHVSRLMEFQSHGWSSDGLSFRQLEDGKWQLGGWWD